MKFSKQTNTILLSILIAFISACSSPNHIKTKKSIEPLVSAQWLKENLDDSDIVLLDTTVIVEMDEKGGFSQKNGIQQYKDGHIPNAVFADLLGDLSAQGDIDFIMPTPEQFKLAMEKLGVGDDSRVVLYSADNPVWAARLWWMLRWIGFDNVAILDGGLKAWKADGNVLSTVIPTYSKKSLTLDLRPELIADRNEVFAGIENNKVDLFDAMPGPHYLGLFSLYSRPGHILSAVNMPTTELLDQSGLYKPLDELDMLIDGKKNNRSISYCGGGVAASAVAFNLFRLGYTDVAVYMGSLNEWAADPKNPMTIIESTE
jgi:thiosulfate/3-mercaptopyruvate sulfurtransferase